MVRARPEPRSRMLPRLPIGFLGLVAVALTACATGPDVDGVWHATAPATGPANSLVYAGPVDAAPLGVELVLGSYGPDAAGLLRYFRSGQFDFVRSPLPPHKECACAYLHQAKVDGTGRVTFALQGCVPGTSPEAPLELRGDLNLLDDGRLAGSLTVTDPSAPGLADRTVQLTFVRVATVATSDPAIVECQQPVDVAGANTASGL